MCSDYHAARMRRFTRPHAPLGQSYRRSFSPYFPTFFRAIFQSPRFLRFFSPKILVKCNFPGFFCFCKTQIVTERLRILIRMSNYFQASEILEKSSPIRTGLTAVSVVLSGPPKGVTTAVHTPDRSCPDQLQIIYSLLNDLGFR